MQAPLNPYRVLALDGGGMRGLYTATLLETLAIRVARARKVGRLDIGRGFDLIVGTSTGGILACGLAKGIPMDQLIDLYRKTGCKIFADPMPSTNIGVWSWVCRNLLQASSDRNVLKEILVKFFGPLTLGQLFTERAIALCIPAVNMATQKSWVFKTPHVVSKRRDEGYQVVDVCLATSAAPMVLPITSIPDPDDTAHLRTFVDGGLWANNPVLIGMIEALEVASPGQPIEILSIGTCAAPEGEPIHKEDTSWGLWRWRFGSKALSVALDAQSSGHHYMAEFLAKHLNRDCTVIRLPQSPPSPAQAEHLSLDKATSEAIEVLNELGKTDADAAYRLMEDGHNRRGEVLKKLFNNIPVAAN